MNWEICKRLEEKPGRLRIIFLDLIIYVLQVTRILIASSLSSQILLDSAQILTSLLMPTSIASAFNASPAPPSSSSSSSPSPSSTPDRNRDDDSDNSSEQQRGGGENDVFYQNDLAADLRFRQTLNQILRPNDESPVDRLPV